MSFTINAEVMDLQGSSVGPISWSSSNEDVVSVDKNGRIKAIATDTSEVRCSCTLDDGTELTAECLVTVVIPVKSISVTSNGLKITRGQQLQIKPVIQPEDATNPSVSYAISNETVATVSDSGLITALTTGSFDLIISANDGFGKKLTVKGTVLQDVQEIVFTPDVISIPIGKSARLSPSILPENAVNKKLIWTSENEDIASVSEASQVTAKGLGTTRIVASSKDGSDIRAACQVIIVEPVKKITLSETSLNAVVTINIQLIAEVLPKTATNPTILWSSSDEKIATVDQNGLVKPVAKGNCTITAAATDGSGTKTQARVKVSQYDVVFIEPGESKTVTYDRLEISSGMFLTDWSSKKGHVNISGGSGTLTLTPVSAGEDIVNVVEKEYFSKKKVSGTWTVYVAPSAVGK